MGPGVGWIQSENLPCFRIAAAHNEKDPVPDFEQCLGNHDVIYGRVLEQMCFTIYFR